MFSFILELILHCLCMQIILASGVKPRQIHFEGANHPKVMSYIEALTGKKIGHSVAIIGAGGFKKQTNFVVNFTN